MRFLASRPVVSTIVWLGAALCLAACGGDGNRRGGGFTVSTAAGSGGSLSPASRDVAQGGTTGFTLSLEPGYELESIGGCGGSLDGDQYTTGPVTSNCTVEARFQLAEYRISTDVNGSGDISPESANVTIEDTTAFTLTPAPDFRVASVSGCGGTLEGLTYQVAGVTEDCTVRAGFEPDVYRVSGTLSATALNDFDSTLNDAVAPLEFNSTFSDPQLINNRATLAGFATAEPANLAPNFPAHFASEADPDDYYRVSLQAGQVVQLHVVDHDNIGSDPPRYTGDLDLYLFAAGDQSQAELASSTGTGEYEEVPVAETGDYIVLVQASSGTSKYVLRMLSEDAVTQTDLSRAQTGDFVPGEMLVLPRTASATSDGSGPTPGVRREALPLEAPKSGASITAQNGSGAPGLSMLRQSRPALYRKWLTLRAIKARRASPEVALASPNYRRYPHAVPNDPRYDLQWHYRAINLPRAWDLTTGTPDTGDAPVVAVVDNGVVLSHPDLQGQLLPGYDFISDDEVANDSDPGIDDDPSDPGDGDDLNPDSWHGTHVAGTVAAASDNDRGGAGVSWGAQILPIRVLGVGGGTSYDVIQGVLYAAGIENDYGLAAPTPADIINLSLGGFGQSDVEADIYARLEQLGILVVASSGNENTTNPLYPASYDSVLSVGATDALGQRAPYSNYGQTLDLAAPGGYLGADANGDGLPDGILSTSAERDGDSIQPGYSLSYQGTSMAAPHVAGVLALMKAVHPGLSPAEVSNLLVAGELTSGQTGRTDELGYGQIDAEKAVAVAYQLANNGGDFDWPAQVVVTPDTLNLGTTSEALVTLDDEGQGEPDTIVPGATEPWLGVTATETVAANGLGDYRITINREGLNDGFYRGQVIFTVDNQSEVTLDVYIEQGSVSRAGEVTRTYVLLVEETDDGESSTAYQAVAQADESGEPASFVFTDVSPGRYSLIAGSDIDADGFICQPGEQCGAYPSLEQEQIIEISKADRTGLDFVTGILGGLIDNSPENSSSKSSKDSPTPVGLPLATPRLPVSTVGAERQVTPQELR